MITRDKIDKILEEYRGKDIAIATMCSHTALQLFYAAKKEGIKTVGICTRETKKVYEAFPLAKPDEFLMVDSYRDPFPEDELVARNAIVIPHGSLVEYQKDRFVDLKVPIFGNRMSLFYEKNRHLMYKWMQESGLKTPKIYTPENIEGPAIVKLPGAKGGQGYRIVKSSEDFEKNFSHLTEEERERIMIQEFISGIRLYPHFFFTKIFEDRGYPTNNGRVELMGMDRRIETNIDEIYRPLAAGIQTTPNFSICANSEIVVRESLLKDIFEMGKKVSDASFKLFGGLYGPFCVETVCTDNLEFIGFEISSRIVAGTNVSAFGSIYSGFSYGKWVGMGNRIVKEILKARELGILNEMVF